MLQFKQAMEGLSEATKRANDSFLLMNKAFSKGLPRNRRKAKKLLNREYKEALKSNS